MTRTIDRLQRDHVNIAKLLSVLERELATFDAAGSPDYDIFQSAAEYFLTYPDQGHHVGEDLVYQRLLQRDPAAAQAIGDVQQEHLALARRLQKFAEVLGNVLADVVITRTTVHDVVSDFIEDQRRHMRMEEMTFFPAALKALTQDDWADLDRRAIDIPDPLFGSDVDPRFAELRQSVQAHEATT